MPSVSARAKFAAVPRFSNTSSSSVLVVTIAGTQGLVKLAGLFEIRDRAFVIALYAERDAAVDIALDDEVSASANGEICGRER